MPIKPTSWPLIWPGSARNQASGAWPFSEGIGNLSYDVQGRHNGVMTNVNWTGGPNGHSLSFNGSSSYVKFGTATELFPSSDGVTIAMSVYQNANKNGSGNGALGNMLFSANKTPVPQFNEFSIDNGTLVYVNTGPAWASTGITIPVKEWTHIAFVIGTDASLSIYVNGKLSAALSNNSFNQQIFSLILGAWASDSTDVAPASGFFDGKMDYVKFYERKLKAQEIAEIAFDPFMEYRRNSRISLYTIPAAAPPSTGLLQSSVSII